jgi:hypothetical protein
MFFGDIRPPWFRERRHRAGGQTQRRGSSWRRQLFRCHNQQDQQLQHLADAQTAPMNVSFERE